MKQEILWSSAGFLIIAVEAGGYFPGEAAGLW